MTKAPSALTQKILRQKILRWYGSHARIMPWRAGKGVTPDPYHVAVSEFMLQQTGVSTVIPYFNRFIARWPTIRHLAKADLEQVRAMWSGLGYYRRAAFLHKMAQTVVAEHNGVLPGKESTLRELPGLGAYAAAAIAAIAHNAPVAVVDGNVERVISRLYALEEKGGSLRKEVYDRLSPLVPKKRAGDFAQSVMELGALVCTPKKPRCAVCPWRDDCKAFAHGTQEMYPVKKQTKKVPEKCAHVFVLTGPGNHVLIRQRHEQGLLGGLWEFPSTPWEAEQAAKAVIATHAPRAIAWKQHATPVIHVFSHFKLQLTLQLGHSRALFNAQDERYRWMKREELSTIGFPTVMRKVADAAFNSAEHPTKHLPKPAARKRAKP